MSKKKLKSRPPDTHQIESMNALKLSNNLPFFLENMKESCLWTQGGAIGRILTDGADKRIVLTALPKGEEIRSFQPDDSITFQIIEGELLVYTGKERISLNTGEKFTLHDQIMYGIKTRQDTIFLYSIKYLI